MRIHLILAAFVGLLLWMASPIFAGELIVVKDGANPIPIVIFEDAPPLTRTAADELAQYIEKTTGAKPQIIEGTPKSIPNHAIWVGYQPVLDSLFPGVDFAFQHPEEILIAANDNHLVIAGRDRWNADHLVVETRRTTIAGRQMEYGSANAVYTFLQKYLNVRWLWPGETGEDIIEQKTVAFEPFEYRYHPMVRARGGLFNFSTYGYGGNYGRSDMWARYQRIQLDSLVAGGGHGFTDWFDRFHEEHPEYFALQPDGSRSGFPVPHRAKLCQSNPAVWDQWIKEVEKELENDPNLTIFNGAPNDGYTSGVCVCESCRAWDHPDGEMLTYHWQGTGQKYVAMSDRYVTFANHLGAKLKERFPDKDYYVLMQAYGQSRPAPVAAKPADNVIIQHVSHFPWKEERREPHKAQWNGWRAMGQPRMMYRPNTGSPAGWQQGLPEVLFNKTIEDFRFIADHEYIGVMVDMVWEHWGTQAPQYYLMAQLTWNPSADGYAILDDFYERAYGKAAPEMKAYWQTFEQARDNYVENTGSFNQSRGLTAVYNSEVMSKTADLLDKADAKLANEPAKYHERMKLMRAAHQHSQLLLEVMSLMKKYTDSGGADTQAEAKTRALWDQMLEIRKAYPLAVNHGPTRPQTPRMRGLHPDHASVSKPSAGASQPSVKVTKGDNDGEVKLLSAEEGGWEHVFTDDFDRDSLGANWVVSSGDWAIENGELKGSGAIVTSKGMLLNGEPGFLRMVYEVKTDVDAVSLLGGEGEGAVRVCDLSAILHAQPLDASEAPPMNTGYFFQFGGYWNAQNQLRRGGGRLLVDKQPKVTITPGKVHQIVVENDQGHLKMFVDGKPVLHQQQDSAIIGKGFDRIGFYFHTAARVSKVSVFVKPVQEQGLDLD